jgi:hypothetical protein
MSHTVARARAGLTANVYEEFARQASVGAACRSDNFGIYLLSPYIVHAASENQVSEFRVFAKVAISAKRFFDNRELRRNRAFGYDDWYASPTLGDLDGFFQHAHFNERFLAADIVPSL